MSQGSSGQHPQPSTHTLITGIPGQGVPACRHMQGSVGAAGVHAFSTRYGMMWICWCVGQSVMWRTWAAQSECRILVAEVPTRVAAQNGVKTGSKYTNVCLCGGCADKCHHWPAYVLSILCGMCVSVFAEQQGKHLEGVKEEEDGASHLRWLSGGAEGLGSAVGDYPSAQHVAAQLRKGLALRSKQALSLFLLLAAHVFKVLRWLPASAASAFIAGCSCISCSVAGIWRAPVLHTHGLSNFKFVVAMAAAWLLVLLQRDPSGAGTLFFLVGVGGADPHRLALSELDLFSCHQCERPAYWSWACEQPLHHKSGLRIRCACGRTHMHACMRVRAVCTLAQTMSRHVIYFTSLGAVSAQEGALR